MANDDGKSRVHHLLANGRISPEDHQSLIAALDARAPKSNFSLAFLVRPFEKLSSSSALFIGALATLILCGVGSQMALQFYGALDFKVLLASEPTFSWLILLAQNAIDVALLSLTFYIGALFARQKNLRLVDFFGSVMLARIPYACFAIFLFIMNPLVPGLLAREIGVQSGTAVLILAVFGISAVIWFFTLCFSALRQSSGLRGQALWFVFIGSLVVAEVLSQVINRGLFA